MSLRTLDWVSVPGRDGLGPLARGGRTTLGSHSSFVFCSAFCLLWLGATRGHADQMPASDVGTVTGLYERVSGAIVGVSCLGRVKGASQPSLFFGTGTIIDPSGLVLTSTTVVPKGAHGVRVYTRGGHEVRARVVLIEPEIELALLRVPPQSRGVQRFPYLRLGDSLALKLGEPAFTLGNAFRSIELDDQVSLSEGIISGLFELTERHVQSNYIGAAIETSAPINSGMDGGPLLDRHGRLVGVLSLNYSRNRWLGTAVPVHRLKPALGKQKGWFSDRDQRYKAYAGLELEEVAGEAVFVLQAFENGPAADAGVTPGTRILQVDDEPVESLESWRRVFALKKPGDRLQLKVATESDERRLDLDLLGKY